MPICSISGCWLPEFRGWTTSPPSRETRSADIASDCLGTQSLRIVAAIPRLGRRECKLSWYFIALSEIGMCRRHSHWHMFPLAIIYSDGHSHKQTFHNRSLNGQMLTCPRSPFKIVNSETCHEFEELSFGSVTWTTETTLLT